MVRASWLVALSAAGAMAAIACGPAAQPASTARPAPPPPTVVADAGVAVDAAPVASAALAPADTATPLDRQLAHLVDRSLAMYRELADALTASGTDCPAAVARLHELAGRYGDVPIGNAKALQDGNALALRAALAPHTDEFNHLAETVMHAPVMAACMTDPAFAKAFDALLEPPP
jgi:hypothetical protein